MEDIFPHKERAARNRTLILKGEELESLGRNLRRLERPASPADIRDSIFYQDCLEALPLFPPASIDLVFADPPYNIDKKFRGLEFKKSSSEQYAAWLESWIKLIMPLLKPGASVYICGDWRSSGAIENVAGKYLRVRNRITFEREKGRGAKNNWKNCSEDIWFFTLGDGYHFDAEAVKVRRKVLAPYRDAAGRAKDWQEGKEENFRLTYPANIWTDITIPFWSMPENTDHPTQKPEKLLAKIILASSRPGDLVLDPFLGSGTTAVVAKKLGRHYAGLELDKIYCCLAEKRLLLADADRTIQGYADGVFFGRNSQLEKQETAQPKPANKTR